MLAHKRFDMLRLAHAIPHQATLARHVALPHTAVLDPLFDDHMHELDLVPEKIGHRNTLDSFRDLRAITASLTRSHCRLVCQSEVQQRLQRVTQYCTVVQRGLLEFTSLGKVMGSFLREVPEVAPLASGVQDDLGVIRKVELLNESVTAVPTKKNQRQEA